MDFLMIFDVDKCTIYIKNLKKLSNGVEVGCEKGCVY